MNLKKRSHLYNIKIQSEAANYPEGLVKITNKGAYPKQEIFHVNKTALYWKKMPFKTYIATEEKSVARFKGQADSLVTGLMHLVILS